MTAPFSGNPLDKTLKILLGFCKVARLSPISVNKTAYVKRAEIFGICLEFSVYFRKRFHKIALDKINPAELIVPPKNFRINAKRFFVRAPCAREIIRAAVEITIPGKIKTRKEGPSKWRQ